MPWSHTSPMDQNIQFIADDLRNRFAVTERCALYGVSRKTGDTWIDRSLARGPQSLEERARRPRTSPRHTPEYVVAAILAARQRHPSWGAKKLVAILSTRHPRWPWPAHSTVCDILSRHGVVPKKRRRRVIRHPGNPISHIGTPNEVWSAACTGHFQTGDGRSRAQQRQFHHCRDEFNHARPHEALDRRTPAACYEPSPRTMPTKLPPLEYPDRFEVRYVSANGSIRWHHQGVNVSTACAGEDVGLEAIDAGVWHVYCGSLKLGRLLERRIRIEDAYGRLNRHR